MAITVRPNPATGASASFPSDYDNQNDKSQAAQRGYFRADLDIYEDGSVVPEILVGSEFEADGDLINVNTGDEAISGIGAIANSSNVYVYYDASAVEFIASTTAPVKDIGKGGWYDSVTGDRCLFRMYKNASGDYVRRTPIDDPFNFIEIFTSSTTFTVPAGVRIIKMTAVGGGGGSGNVWSGSTLTIIIGGGGAGGVSKNIVNVSEGDVLTITVGVGGAGGAGTASVNNGAAGGASSVVRSAVNLVTANGGAGTLGRSSSGVTDGGAGGTAIDGLINHTGGNGAYGNYNGAGGSCIMGIGGININTGNRDGVPGNNYGGGASGPMRTSAGISAGGDGADGVVILEY